jgi:hypothetical protein
VRAYLLKEDFQQFWEYHSPTWAAKFLDDWCQQVMRSRIEPMKKVANTLGDHRELILNYLARLNNSWVKMTGCLPAVRFCGKSRWIFEQRNGLA